MLVMKLLLVQSGIWRFERMEDEYDFEAKFYDVIWGKHDYDADVKFLGKLLKENHCKSILDVGCGTGNHALRLDKKGYDVTGIDVSPAMLEKPKLKARGSDIRFLQANMKDLKREFPKKEKFDAAICLGSVSFHLLTDDDVKRYLKGLHMLLRKGGLLVCNVRNARKINDAYLNKLNFERMEIEDKLQVLVLEYNARDKKDPNTIVWRPIFLVNDKGKIDFQMREHKLKWFLFSTWKKLLTSCGFKLTASYSGPTETRFNESEHENLWLVANTR